MNMVHINTNTQTGDELPATNEGWTTPTFFHGGFGEWYNFLIYVDDSTNT